MATENKWQYEVTKRGEGVVVEAYRRRLDGHLDVIADHKGRIGTTPDFKTMGQHAYPFHSLEAAEAAVAVAESGERSRRYTERGEGDKVQFRCPRALRLAVLSRAEAEGIDEREAWERAGREWADRG